MQSRSSHESRHVCSVYNPQIIQGYRADSKMVSASYPRRFADTDT